MKHIQVPADTPQVIEDLVKEASAVLADLPIMNRLLLTGAILDAQNLLQKINRKQ